MTFADFLETYSLYRKAIFQRTFDDADPVLSGCNAIHMDCDQCNSQRTFVYEETPSLFHNRVRLSEDLPASIVPEYQPFDGGNDYVDKWEHVFYLCYRCSYCKISERVFFVWTNADRTTFMKVGQFPAFDIGISKDIKALLHEHEDIYKKGLICETHNFGIGAFAYYRRIVELIIDKLLESIDSLLEGEEK